MRQILFLFLLFSPSCALMEAAMEPAAIGLAAAGGALVGGPAGGAVAAGSAKAAFDIMDAEEEVDEAEAETKIAVAEKEQLTMAILESKILGNNAPLQKYAKEQGEKAAQDAIKYAAEQGDKAWVWVKVLFGLIVVVCLIIAAFKIFSARKMEKMLVSIGRSAGLGDGDLKKLRLVDREAKKRERTEQRQEGW